MNRRSLAAGGAAAVLVAAVCAGCADGDSSQEPSVTPTSAPAHGETGRSPAGGRATVSVRPTRLGNVLVDAEGRTLYVFAADTSTESTCEDACAKAWPPLMTSGGPRAEEGTSADRLGTSRRSDGTQVTYDGHPLYTYAGDEKPGDVNGQELDQFGARWFALEPSGERVEGS